MVFCVEVIGWGIMVVMGAKLLFNCCYFFYTTYLAAALGHNLGPQIKQYGSWAVVTGATDGIGKVYAQQLAALGLNIILVSRSSAKLQQVSDEICRQNREIQIKTVAVDFTDGNAIYPKLKKELAHLFGQIGILVNNVGTKLPHCHIADVPSGEQFNEIINCNVMSMVRLTNMLLPAMRKKKRGLIINIGSLSGTGFSPMRTTYGATKAFVDKFSCDLAAECRSEGVVVQSILPGYVATKLPGLSGKSSFDVPTVETYVEAAIRSLGVETRTAAYWFHKILLYWTELLYFFVPNFVQKLTVIVISRKTQMANVNKHE
ncbi:very-long-chain 3-oxoacyl-CoA reductase-like [Daphnia carinata]|uniref:very-long-chain 3-oxoacyl-CoA reductase-like n=1 Tax=Daphnia carinata TaxID=120202 RepID=UPI002868859F|nr:very-long-chain 3-oxoacyl-CoA reductase-like [Daphnia carinata]